ncbi:membrane protein [Candidatus Magnetobacterium bavaricum]|uniref:Membrane protein n=1 Tax=Candidatus Magnetobacterium bavaricum TaxID=29290 RepID=A0A0F3GWU2_9BACT|nr:membrane protein [Candidatus Magnetobacterium bavaricum]
MPFSSTSKIKSASLSSVICIFAFKGVILSALMPRTSPIRTVTTSLSVSLIILSYSLAIYALIALNA